MKEPENNDKGTDSRRRARGPLVAAAVAVAVVIAIGIGAVLASREPQTAAVPVEQATAFWVAVSAGDREVATSYLDPDAAESGEANLFGRSWTFENQFDWYEAIGWKWTLDQCVEVEGGAIECTVAARNDWSDAIGLEPIDSVHVVEVAESGITAIVDKDENFRSQWLPRAFEVFGAWVGTHHPADAAIMFNREVDLNQEILQLYEINTARFVEAYPTG
ncbi:MAG: hypothetical protein ACRDX9_08955 [Acidimicrobiia bacterium]